MEDEMFVCEECGGEHFGSFVQYGSYLFLCLKCKWGPCTSFMAVGPKMKGLFEAIEVDENYNEMRLISKGEMPEMYEIIEK